MAGTGTYILLPLVIPLLPQWDYLDLRQWNPWYRSAQPGVNLGCLGQIWPKHQRPVQPPSWSQPAIPSHSPCPNIPWFQTPAPLHSYCANVLSWCSVEAGFSISSATPEEVQMCFMMCLYHSQAGMRDWNQSSAILGLHSKTVILNLVWKWSFMTPFQFLPLLKEGCNRNIKLFIEHQEILNKCDRSLQGDILRIALRTAGLKDAAKKKKPAQSDQMSL